MVSVVVSVVVSVGPSVPIGTMSSAFPGTAAGGRALTAVDCVWTGVLVFAPLMQTATGGSRDGVYIYIMSHFCFSITCSMSGVPCLE